MACVVVGSLGGVTRKLQASSLACLGTWSPVPSAVSVGVLVWCTGVCGCAHPHTVSPPSSQVTHTRFPSSSFPLQTSYLSVEFQIITTVTPKLRFRGTRRSKFLCFQLV